MKPMPPPVRRALLSVSDKTGLIELARALARRNIEILSTGGTAQLLTHNGVPVREVADYTGFPEIRDGRVKTLHPKFKGGPLAPRGGGRRGRTINRWWWSSIRRIIRCCSLNSIRTRAAVNLPRARASPPRPS